MEAEVSMRCQCGFNSFDHNLVCPKCQKDLTATRRLLNLDVPVPGMVNFFQVAGQRMAVPQPFPGAAVGNEDFFGEDLQPLEDIQPIAYGANQPLPAEKTIAAKPLSDISAYGTAVEEITPVSPQAVPYSVPASSQMQPRPPQALAAPVKPPHQVAMDQIKSTLTETGDLNPQYAAPALNQAVAPGEGDDFSSLAGEMNIDELEGDL
jgi:hypothetical protein